MRYTRNIHLKRFILHVLDTSEEKVDPVLADIAISPPEEIEEYILTHIRNSLNNANTKAARFLSPSANRGRESDDRKISPLCQKILDPHESTARICTKMLADEQYFIEGSKKLACKLFQIMLNNLAIASGDLAICIYQSGDDPAANTYIALLKLDPSPVYIHKIAEDAQGNQVITLELLDIALPTEEQNLQKCAFIKPPDPISGYDMMLLDRQVRLREKRPVAEFFAVRFLEAALALDDRERTHRFYATSIEACNELRPLLDEDKYNRLRASVDEELHYPEINIDQWLRRLKRSARLTSKQIAAIDEKISEQLPDRKFNVDRFYVDGVQKLRRFVGDFGLQVDIRADRLDRVIDHVEWVQVEGDPDHFEVRIRVRKWREIVRFVQRDLSALEEEEEVLDVLLQPAEAAE